MAMSLDEFYKEFFQDVISESDADGNYKEDSFFDRFCIYANSDNKIRFHSI